MTQGSSEDPARGSSLREGEKSLGGKNEGGERGQDQQIEKGCQGLRNDSPVDVATAREKSK